MTSYRNVLFDYVKTAYRTEPEYPWAKHPNSAVLRHADNRKWYAGIFDVSRKALGLDGAGKVDVLNIKCAPEIRDAFLPQPGFLPAYHMDKNHWLTALLDGSVDKDTLIFLLNASFDLTATRQTKRALQINARTHWVVPANPKLYDVEKDLRAGDEILWKQSSNVAADDIVYLYVTAPTAAIRYQCLVLEPNIFYRSKLDGQRKRGMRLRCLQEFAPDRLPRAFIRTFGLTNIRGPRRMPQALCDEIAGWK